MQQMLLSSDILRFKITPSLLDLKQEGKQPLSIVLTTSTLSQLLQSLIESGSLILSTADSSANLLIEKHMGCPYWNLNFTVRYTIDFLHLLLKFQLPSHCAIIRLRGSLTQSFKFGGCFSNGIITLHQPNLTDEILQLVVSSDKMETMIYTPQITTLDEISNLGKHKIVPLEGRDVSNLMSLISTTLSFTRREIKQILGPGGSRLDSIRIQLKCWIHIDLNPYEQSVIENMRFVGKKNQRQEVTINGLKKNVDIAVYEIHQCVLADESL